MEKNYTRIDFLGSTIDDMVQGLITYPIKNNGLLAFCEFNGKTFYSDTVSLDSAYLELTNKSYFQFHKERNTWLTEYERKEAEFKACIPELTKEWIKKGHKILSEDKWKCWDEIVPIRLDDIYHGMELECCLTLVEMLNNNQPFSEIKLELERQGHSGMSSTLVYALIMEFSDRGKDFIGFIKGISI